MPNQPSSTITPAQLRKLTDVLRLDFKIPKAIVEGIYAMRENEEKVPFETMIGLYNSISKYEALVWDSIQKIEELVFPDPE